MFGFFVVELLRMFGFFFVLLCFWVVKEKVEEKEEGGRERERESNRERERVGERERCESSGSYQT